MTVAELIEQLKALEPTAVVTIVQIYQAGTDTEVTGLLHNNQTVTLTDEENN